MTVCFFQGKEEGIARAFAVLPRARSPKTTTTTTATGSCCFDSADVVGVVAVDRRARTLRRMCTTEMREREKGERRFPPSPALYWAQKCRKNAWRPPAGFFWMSHFKSSPLPASSSHAPLCSRPCSISDQGRGSLPSHSFLPRESRRTNEDDARAHHCMMSALRARAPKGRGDLELGRRKPPAAAGWMVWLRREAAFLCPVQWRGSTTTTASGTCTAKQSSYCSTASNHDLLVARTRTRRRHSELCAEREGRKAIFFFFGGDTERDGGVVAAGFVVHKGVDVCDRSWIWLRAC